MRIHRKLAIAAGAGVAGLGLFGMVALAAFAPDTGGGTRAFVAPTGAQSAVEKPKPQDKLKDLLDGLVAKGVITQTQETTILAAVNDRSPRAKVEASSRRRPSTWAFPRRNFRRSCRGRASRRSPTARTERTGRAWSRR